MNCYAERMASRLAAMGRPEYQGLIKGGRWNGKVRVLPERLDQPLRWKKAARIFVDSMSDLFHENIDFGFIGLVYNVMLAAPQHTYIILTKRPERMVEFYHRRMETVWQTWYPSNLWLGVSVENQAAADERIPLLLQTPAAKRFISFEPMLEQIDARYYLNGCPEQVSSRSYVTLDMAMDAGNLDFEGMLYSDDEWEQTAPPIDWVICGCESGTNARPFNMDWARDLKDQCAAARVPFFFKQGRVDGRLVKMPELDGRVWDQYPEVEKL